LDQEYEKISPERDPAEGLSKLAHGAGVKKAGKSREKVGCWQLAEMQNVKMAKCKMVKSKSFHHLTI